MVPTPLDFATLFEVAPNPYMVLDAGLRYVAANAAYLEVTASRREQLIGHHVLELFPNDPTNPNNGPAQLLRKSLERVLASGEREHLAYIPYRVPKRLPDGSVTEENRYWSATHVPIRDAAGAVTHVLQHTVDVTELHAREHARSESDTGVDIRDEAGVLSRARAVQEENARLGAYSEQLRVLFEQAPGFMAVLEGADHVFRLVNEAYVRLIGSRDVIGKSVIAALPEVVEQGFIGILDEVRASGKPFIGEGIRIMIERLPGAAPQECFIDFIYQPVRGQNGAITGIFVQGHDVTARLRAERETMAARRAAEAFAEELKEQSEQVAAALAGAEKRLAELEARVGQR